MCSETFSPRICHYVYRLLTINVGSEKIPNALNCTSQSAALIKANAIQKTISPLLLNYLKEQFRVVFENVDWTRWLSHCTFAIWKWPPSSLRVIYKSLDIVGQPFRTQINLYRLCQGAKLLDHKFSSLLSDPFLKSINKNVFDHQIYVIKLTYKIKLKL